MHDSSPPNLSAVAWRRVMVLLILLLLGAGIFLIWSAGRGGSAPQRGDTVQLPEGTFDTAGEPGAVGDGEAKECGAGVLKVVAHTDKDSYGPEELPKLSLSVENTGDVACYKNLGTSQMVFEVQTGTQTVWLSTHCQTQSDDRVVLLEPGKPLTTMPLEWNRTASAEATCEVQRDAVTADGAAYHLLVAVGEVPARESKQFLLH